MTAVPDGLPAYFAAGKVARVLRLSDRSVRHYLDTGHIPCVQPGGRSGWRLVPAADLAAFADKHALSLDWEAAL